MTYSIDILKKLIKINTENPPGYTKEILLWIENWARVEGISVSLQDYEENKGNIILAIGNGEKSILICGHLDTVPIGDLNNWEFDPLEAEENEGYIYGRGSADMKSGV